MTHIYANGYFNEADWGEEPDRTQVDWEYRKRLSPYFILALICGVVVIIIWRWL